MNQIIGLIRLQQIDTRLDRVNTRLHQIKLIFENDQEIREILTQINEYDLKLNNIKRDITTNEINVKNQQVKIQQLQANLYSGKVLNPKELQDLEAEIASCQRQLNSSENRLLDLMINCEEIQTEYDAISSKLISTQESSDRKNSLLLAEKANLLREIEKLKSEKKASEISITEKDLNIYNKLRIQKGGIALSVISENACSSCGATLTPAQHQAVRALDHIIFCPSCGRILFTT